MILETRPLAGFFVGSNDRAVINPEITRDFLEKSGKRYSISDFAWRLWDSNKAAFCFWGT
jgi:hypothetical protein